MCSLGDVHAATSWLQDKAAEEAKADADAQEAVAAVAAAPPPSATVELTLQEGTAGEEAGEAGDLKAQERRPRFDSMGR